MKRRVQATLRSRVWTIFLQLRDDDNRLAKKGNALIRMQGEDVIKMIHSMDKVFLNNKKWH